MRMQGKGVDRHLERLTIDRSTEGDLVSSARVLGEKVRCLMLLRFQELTGIVNILADKSQDLLAFGLALWKQHVSTARQANERIEQRQDEG